MQIVRMYARMRLRTQTYVRTHGNGIAHVILDSPRPAGQTRIPPCISIVPNEHETEITDYNRLSHNKDNISKEKQLARNINLLGAASVYTDGDRALWCVCLCVE